MRTEVRIDRCYCFDRTFAEIADVLREKNPDTFDALREAADFGWRCELCHPYVRRMMRTGETVFSEVVVESTGRGA